MPSKKKKKSKGGRKAAKKVEKQGELLDKQMERLKIDKDEDSQTNADEDALLEEAIKFAAAEKEKMDAATAEKEEGQLQVQCRHGNVVEAKELIYFVNTFIRTLSYAHVGSSSGDGTVLAGISAATDAVKEKYPNVWYDPSKMKLVVSYFVCNGTQYVLQGDFIRARLFAVMASYFETIAGFRRSNNVDANTNTAAKMLELGKCDDEHTLVKYLKKRIPCSCLDEVYEEVKSITRTGVCFSCSSVVERSKMLTCSRCGKANYCGRKCQKAHWPNHKDHCGVFINS